MIVSMLIVVSASAQLQFNDRGELKIVQFTDAHLRDDRPDQATLTLNRLKWIIDTEQPDVVIFTGDAVTDRRAAMSWRSLLDITARTETPFVVVLGNHDLEQDLTAEELAMLITSYPNTLNRAEDGTLDDLAIEVLSSNGERVAALLYCLDSQDYSTIEGVGGYGWIKHDQVAWYRTTSSLYTENNGGIPLPAYAFFHIPLPEYRDAADRNSKLLIGERGEDECAPELNSGMYLSMLEMGDVVATFVGHDHNNNYAVPYHDIALVYGHYSGDNTVYNNLYRGVRVIKLTEGERDFETWVTDDRPRNRGQKRDHVRFNTGKKRFDILREYN